jgi:hypothetical protein
LSLTTFDTRCGIERVGAVGVVSRPRHRHTTTS